MARQSIAVERPTFGPRMKWPWRASQLSIGESYPRFEALECRLLMSSVPQALAISLASSSLAYIEKQGAEAVDPDLTIQAPGGTMIRNASIDLAGYVQGEDSLSACEQNGISAWWDSADGVLMLSGQATVADYQVELRSVTYTNPSYDPTTSPRIAEFTITDEQFDRATSARRIVITAVNDPPGIETPPGQVTNCGSSIIFSNTWGNAIVISDVDGNGAVEQVTLLSTNGTLRLASTPGVEEFDSNGTLWLIGRLDSINAALDDLTFTPAIAYAGSAFLKVSADDLGNSGVGGAQIVNALVPISIIGPAAPPPLVSDISVSPPATNDGPVPAVGATPPAGPADIPPSSAPAVQPVARISQSLAAEVASSGVTASSAGVRPDPNDSRAGSTGSDCADQKPTPIGTSNTSLTNDSATPTAPHYRDSGTSGSLPYANVWRPTWSALAAVVFEEISSHIATHDVSCVFDTAHEHSTGWSAQARLRRSGVDPSLTATLSAPFPDPEMFNELDAIRRRFSPSANLRVWAGTASVLSAGVSLAYFLWVARGGSLLSGVFSALSTWNVLDPLPILDQAAKTGAMFRNEDDGLEKLINRATGT